MKKISLLIILCFLFQGCISMMVSSNSDTLDRPKVEETILKDNSCNFEEVLSQKVVKAKHFYSARFVLAGSVSDLGLSAYYFAAFNPKGLVLFATAAYAYLSFGFAALTIVTIFDESKIAIQPVGWNQSNGIECKEEYFILRFEDEEQLKQGEKYFLKAILNYPQNQDISQDQNFLHFQKDFLRNNKMQTYYKDKYFYRYIHYPGGKAKFEEDFGKYLYKP
jgi:hypothetical protein